MGHAHLPTPVRSQVCRHRVMKIVSPSAPAKNAAMMVAAALAANVPTSLHIASPASVRSIVRPNAATMNAVTTVAVANVVHVWRAALVRMEPVSARPAAMAKNAATMAVVEPVVRAGTRDLPAWAACAPVIAHPIV
jgi:hypothetical protein